MWVGGLVGGTTQTSGSLKLRVTARLCRKKGEKKKRAEKGRLKKPPFIFVWQKKGAWEKKNKKGEKRA